MLVGAIFLTLAAAVAATMYIVLPLWENRTVDELVPRKEVLQSEYRRSALLADRDRLLSALLELDADYELDKIPAGEYAPLREKLVHEAALILRSLDEINLSGKHLSVGVVKNNPADQADLEEMISLRKNALRKNALSENALSENALSENQLSNNALRNNALRNQELSELRDGQGETPNLPDQLTTFQAYCTHCGNPLMSGDKYCPVCGSKIPS